MATVPLPLRSATPRTALAAGGIIAVGLALALLPLPLAVAAGGAAIALTAGLARPLVLLALTPFAVPFGTLVMIGGEGIAAGGLELALAAALGAWLVHTLADRERRVRWPLVLAPLAAWTVFAALSATTAVAPGVALKEMVKWVEAAVALWLAANLAVTARARLVLFAAIALAAGAEALLGAYQFFTRSGPEGFLIGDRYLRAYGTFGQPNPFAGYLALVVPLVLAWVLGRPGGPRPALTQLVAFGITGGVLVAAIAMSLSRGAWIALVAGMTVVLAVHSRAGRLLLGGGVLAALTVGLIGMFGLLPPAITSRLEVVTRYAQVFDARTVAVTPENFAIVERMAIWQAAWAMFNDAPLLGVGLGNFDVRYLDYALRGWTDLPGHAHNYYLTLLAETGVLGLATFVFMYGFLMAAAWRAARQARHAGAPADAYAWAVGALGMFTVVAVHNLFDSLFVHGIPVHLGLVLGTALAPHAAASSAGPPFKG